MSMFGIPIMIIQKHLSLRNQFLTKTEFDCIIEMSRHQAMKRSSSMSSSIRIVQKRLFRNVVRNFIITVERELLAEVVGETKVCVTDPCRKILKKNGHSDDESSSHEHGHNHGR